LREHHFHARFSHLIFRGGAKVDFSTNYLGFKLPHPFIAGAGPLADTVESAKRLEDAGAAAIVMRSLFEEQLDSKAAMTRTSAMKLEEYVMSPDKKGYESLEQLHSPMNTLRTRANYIRLLQTWQWA
jgi:hypothetical protein